MESGWIKIATSSSTIEAEMIKGMLEDNNIPTVILNKQSSAYLTFGYIEIYVAQADAELATQLLQPDQL